VTYELYRRCAFYARNIDLEHKNGADNNGNLDAQAVMGKRMHFVVMAARIVSLVGEALDTPMVFSGRGANAMRLSNACSIGRSDMQQLLPDQKNVTPLIFIYTDPRCNIKSVSSPSYTINIETEELAARKALAIACKRPVLCLWMSNKYTRDPPVHVKIQLAVWGDTVLDNSVVLSDTGTDSLVKAFGSLLTHAEKDEDDNYASRGDNDGGGSTSPYMAIPFESGTHLTLNTLTIIPSGYLEAQHPAIHSWMERVVLACHKDMDMFAAIHSAHLSVDLDTKVAERFLPNNYLLTWMVSTVKTNWINPPAAWATKSVSVCALFPHVPISISLTPPMSTRQQDDPLSVVYYPDEGYAEVRITNAIYIDVAVAIVITKWQEHLEKKPIERERLSGLRSYVKLCRFCALIHFAHQCLTFNPTILGNDGGWVIASIDRLYSAFQLLLHSTDKKTSEYVNTECGRVAEAVLYYTNTHSVVQMDHKGMLTYERLVGRWDAQKTAIGDFEKFQLDRLAESKTNNGLLPLDDIPSSEVVQQYRNFFSASLNVVPVPMNQQQTTAPASKSSSSSSSNSRSATSAIPMLLPIPEDDKWVEIHYHRLEVFIDAMWKSRTGAATFKSTTGKVPSVRHMTIGQASHWCSQVGLKAEPRKIPSSSTGLNILNEAYASIDYFSNSASTERDPLEFSDSSSSNSSKNTESIGPYVLQAALAPFWASDAKAAQTKDPSSAVVIHTVHINYKNATFISAGRFPFEAIPVVPFIPSTSSLLLDDVVYSMRIPTRLLNSLIKRGSGPIPNDRRPSLSDMSTNGQRVVTYCHGSYSMLYVVRCTAMSSSMFVESVQRTDGPAFYDLSFTEDASVPRDYNPVGRTARFAQYAVGAYSHRMAAEDGKASNGYHSENAKAALRLYNLFERARLEHARGHVSRLEANAGIQRLITAQQHTQPRRPL
jgi:hypothetical protein